MASQLQSVARTEVSHMEGRGEQALREMMVSYQRADGAAAERLVQHLSPQLLRILWSPKDCEYAEDLLQECWLRIHKARHTYRPGSPLLPWVYAIARNTRLDGYRRSRRRQSHEVAMGDFPERALWTKSTPECTDDGLLRSLDELPESQREVIFMLKVSGMSLKEVAQATSSTVGAVKQKASRGYETLRRVIGNDCNGSGKRNELQPVALH